MTEVELLPHILCREALDWAADAARELGIRDVELHVGADAQSGGEESLDPFLDVAHRP